MNFSPNDQPAKDKLAAITISTISTASPSSKSPDNIRRAKLLHLAKELSRVRKWLKFLRILRGWRGIPKLLTSGDDLTKLEAFADIFQMVTEDVNNLHLSGLWEGLLGLSPIPNIDAIEDYSWFFWSSVAAYNAGKELQIAFDHWTASKTTLDAIIEAKKFHANDQSGAGSTGRSLSEGGNEGKSVCQPTEKKASEMNANPLDAETAAKVLHFASTKRLMTSAINFLKFVCEVGDSGLAIAPTSWKAQNEKFATVASALLGSTSALCSIHKFISQ